MVVFISLEELGEFTVPDGPDIIHRIEQSSLQVVAVGIIQLAVGKHATMVKISIIFLSWNCIDHSIVTFISEISLDS